MSKIISIWFCILMVYSSAKGQTSFGIKAGVNLSYTSFEQSDPLILFHAGGFGHIPLSDRFFMQPELLLSLKGGDLSGLLIEPYTLDITRYDLSIPLLIGLKTGDKFEIRLGPEVNFLLASTTDFNDQILHDTYGYKKLDFCLDAGMGLKISNRFTIDFRYCYGLTDAIDLHFTDINGGSLGGTGKGKTRVFQLGLDYVFPQD
ncbi:MAG: porin family protein [Saprospiraceae bacterium]